MKKNFIIHTKMLEVALWLFQKVNTFPKKQRFVIGQRIEQSTLESMRIITEVNLIKDAQFAYQKLDQLNIELAILRDLLRIAYEMKFLRAESMQYIIQNIDEVGKMCGGWQKSYKSSKSDS